MKVKHTIEIEAKETNTQGTHAYLVAMCCGGIMEDPEIYYLNHQIILADSKKEAAEKYNEINKCNYYYGHVLEVLY